MTSIVEGLWVLLGVFALALEGFGLAESENTLSLTAILRDHYMNRYGLVRLVVFLFWAWLGGHFFLGVA